MKKIAFCFLLYDIINHEDLWYNFFKNIDHNKYNIYIHYKNNVPLKYFEKYKINNCIETQYAHISLTQAQNILLKKALEDNNNQHFIILSNSCIPLKNFDYIYNHLDETKSYFNVAPQEQCFPRCNSILNIIEKKYIQKQHAWCILNRKHTELMLKDTQYINWFKDIYCPEEHCYITMLYIYNLQDELITTLNLAIDATTFTNWQGMDYKYPCYSGLKNYSNISEDELIYLLKSKSLFGRKFTVDCRNSLNKEFYINFISS